MAPLRPVLKRILADIQERLTFRAQAFIRVWSGSQQPRICQFDISGTGIIYASTSRALKLAQPYSLSGIR